MASKAPDPLPDPGSSAGPATLSAPDSRSTMSWQDAVGLASFQDLLRLKVRVLTPLMVVSLGVFLAVMLLAGFARDLMIVKVGPLGVGYLLIIGLYGMCWVLGVLYMRIAAREFDPRAERARLERRGA